MDCYENTLKMLINTYMNDKPLSHIVEEDSISRFCRSDDTDIRIWTAKALAVDIACDCTIDSLCMLSLDKDPSVRVEAIDSLSNFFSPKSYHALCSAINDTDELVRAFAAFGIAVVGNVISSDHAKQVLQSAELNEKSERVMVGIYEGLYLLGISSCLKRLIELYQSEDYHVRCAVLHALTEILDEDNRATIESAVGSFDLSWQPLSVTNAIDQLKSACVALSKNAK